MFETVEDQFVSDQPYRDGLLDMQNRLLYIDMQLQLRRLSPHAGRSIRGPVLPDSYRPPPR